MLLMTLTALSCPGQGQARHLHLFIEPRPLTELTLVFLFFKEDTDAQRAWWAPKHMLLVTKETPP